MSNPQAILKTLQEAATNNAARQAFVSDPRKVLDKAGLSIPESTKITVHVNDAKTFHAVLPLEAPGEIEMVRQVNPLAALVYEKAWRDPAYKKQLMSQPREAFVSATGVTPPVSMKLVPHENTTGEMHLVVPYVPTSSELSDADLEHVAGGKGAAAVDAACNEATGVGMGVAQIGASAGGTPGGVIALGGLLVAGGAALGSILK